MNQQYIQNRINLVEKASKNKKYKPTKEELQSAYGYLDSCLDCGKEFLPFEPYSHCLLGNRHKFGCSVFMRFVGFTYNIFLLPLKLLAFLIIALFYFGWMLINKLRGIENE